MAARRAPMEYSITTSASLFSSFFEPVFTASTAAALAASTCGAVSRRGLGKRESVLRGLVNG